MDLFIEKEFAENFQIEYYPGKETEIQKIIYSIFSEYTGINWFLNASEDFVKENELLFKLSDYNLNYKLDVDFDKLFDNEFIPKKQTIVLTEKPRAWFSILKEKGVLCFSYDNNDKELKDFIKATHFKIDLSDKENFSFNWNEFYYLNKQTNFIIISDPYVLCDIKTQKIKDNLIPLLKNNLNKNHSYTIFIITEINDAKEIIERKIRQIYSSLNDYSVKIFVFNRLKKIEEIVLHDRLLYSNYTITSSGIGFNLNSKKAFNSEIYSASIFEKYTYKRLAKHLKKLEKYVTKLRNLEDNNKPYKTNSEKAYNAFKELI